MKVYVVQGDTYEDYRIFSTLDKAKKFCCHLAEQDFESNPEYYEEVYSFDEENVEFNDGENGIHVEYEYNNIAIITVCEVE